MVNEYYLFIKLTEDYYKQYTGGNIMQTYQAYLNSYDRKHVWFDGNLVHPHMAKKHVDYFNNKKNGKVYFADSKTKNGQNEINFEATILAVISDYKIKCPEWDCTPKEWRDLESNVWLKLTDIKECKSLKTKDFKIISTDRNLEDATKKSRCHFCYIVKE